MKVTGSIIKEEQGYKPHSVTFEFRTEEEFNAIYCIFNQTDICEFLETDCKDGNYNSREIRRVLNMTNPNNIDIDYNILFDKLRERIKNRK